MKNNFITKIIGATLAFAMMIGGAVGINAAKQAKEVNADDGSYSYTFAAKQFTANDQTKELGGVNWTAAGSGSYWGYDGTKGQQFGSGSAVTRNLTLTTSDITGTISSIVVQASTAKDSTANINCTVGGNGFGAQAQSLTNTNSSYTFSGSASGEIVINLKQPSTSKALYIKAFTINYSTGGGEQPANTVQSVSINNAPQSQISGVIVGSTGPTLSATATMRTGDAVPTFTWASDNEDAVIINATSGAIQYVGNGTAHITATASLPAGDQQGDTNVATVTIETSNLKGASDSNPLSVEEALSVAEAAGTTETVFDCYTAGIISRVGSDAFNSQYGNKTFWISDDGNENDELEAYRCLYLDNKKMTEAQFNSVEAGDTVTVVGKLINYNSQTKEYTQGCYLTSHNKPALPRVSINENSQSINVGETLALSVAIENPVENYSISWVSGNNSVLTVESTGQLTARVTAGNSAGSTTVTAKMLNANDEPVATSASITITVVAPVLVDGDTFIISGSYSNTTYYLTGVENSLGTTGTTKANAIILTAIEGTTSGQFQFKNGNNYLNYTGSSNELKTTTDGTSASSFWTIASNGDNVIITNVNANTRRLQFNYNNGNPRFACYTSNQLAISIEKVVAPEVDEVTVMGDSSANANGAVSVVKDFLYEVSYVDPLHTGNSSVSVTVLNSSDTADGAEVTTAPSNGSFSVTFTASDTYTVTVTSLEDDTKSDSTTITVTNIYVPPVPVSRDYELYGNDLVEGDYIFYYDGGAMNNTIDGDRAQFEQAAPVSDTISTDDNSIIWHIAPASEEGFFTIYNAEAGKFLASTGAKSKAQLLADGTDDKALWSVARDNDVFDFTNKYNAAKDVNATLRKNGSYGFACYATGTGGKLSLYRLNDINAYLSSAFAVATLTDDILRLGSSIPESAWNSVAGTAEITDYGVMIYKTDSEANITSDTPVEDAYRAGVVQPAIARTGHGNAPTAVDGNCVFTARMRVSNPETIFCAASFMVVGGQYYFFNEQHITAGQLA